MMPQVTAILVNYNAGDELAVALRSIQRDCARVPWEAVVVDNASSDDSAAVVETFPQATLIRNPANVGFGRAVNQAAALAARPLLLLINPDCRLIWGTIHVAIRARRRAVLCRGGTTDSRSRWQGAGSARGDPDMLTGLFGRTGALRSLPISRRRAS